MKNNLSVIFNESGHLGFAVSIKRENKTILIENFSEHDPAYEFAIELADLLECPIEVKG